MMPYRLIVVSQALPGREAAYCQWCDEQHFPDILRIPGVVSAERMQLLDAEAGAPGRYLAVFRLDRPPSEVMAEMVRRNGTPEMPVGTFHDREKLQFLSGEIIGTWDAPFD